MNPHLYIVVRDPVSIADTLKGRSSSIAVQVTNSLSDDNDGNEHSNRLEYRNIGIGLQVGPTRFGMVSAIT